MVYMPNTFYCLWILALYILVTLLSIVIYILIFKWKCKAFSRYFWNTYITEVIPKESDRVKSVIKGMIKEDKK